MQNSVEYHEGVTDALSAVASALGHTVAAWERYPTLDVYRGVCVCGEVFVVDMPFDGVKMKVHLPTVLRCVRRKRERVST
jgi:uncharacterized membrane protein YeiB